MGNNLTNPKNFNIAKSGGNWLDCNSRNFIVEFKL